MMDIKSMLGLVENENTAVNYLETVYGLAVKGEDDLNRLEIVDEILKINLSSYAFTSLKLKVLEDEADFAKQNHLFGYFDKYVLQLIDVLMEGKDFPKLKRKLTKWNSKKFTDYSIESILTKTLNLDFDHLSSNIKLLTCGVNIVDTFISDSDERKTILLEKLHGVNQKGLSDAEEANRNGSSYNIFLYKSSFAKSFENLGGLDNLMKSLEVYGSIGEVINASRVESKISTEKSHELLTDAARVCLKKGKIQDEHGHYNPNFYHSGVILEKFVILQDKFTEHASKIDFDKTSNFYEIGFLKHLSKLNLERAASNFVGKYAQHIQNKEKTMERFVIINLEIKLAKMYEIIDFNEEARKIYHSASELATEYVWADSEMILRCMDSAIRLAGDNQSYVEEVLSFKESFYKNQDNTVGLARLALDRGDVEKSRQYMVLQNLKDKSEALTIWPL